MRKFLVLFSVLASTAFVSTMAQAKSANVAKPRPGHTVKAPSRNGKAKVAGAPEASQARKKRTRKTI